jgi:hypothetical protein
MSASLIPNEYNLASNIPGEMPGIPREAILDTVPRSALAATKKIVNLVPVSSNAAGPSSTVQFLIPQRNMIQAHSVYLKFKLSVTADGPTRPYSFSGAQQSAGSLINNLSVQAGGAIVESLQNYHLWHNNVMVWSAQGNDRLGVESVCSGSLPPSGYMGKWTGASLALAAEQFDQQRLGYYTGTTPAINTGQSNLLSLDQLSRQFVGNQVDVVYSIPLFLGFFNPKESQLIPLQFINGGVLLTIQTNPISKAFFSDATGAAGITSYELKDMELCYHEIQPSPEYVLRVRDELNGGKRIRIECQSYLNYQTQDSAAIRQVFNTSMTSCASIFWGKCIGADSLTTPKMFQSWTADGDSNLRMEVYLDNVLLYQSPNQLNTIATQMRQLQEALTNSVTDYGVSPTTIGRGVVNAYGTMSGNNMLWGLSTKLFASNSTSMDGTPVNTITFNFTSQTGVNAANIIYAFVVYDYIYTVLPTGSIDKFM